MEGRGGKGKKEKREREKEGTKGKAWRLCPLSGETSSEGSLLCPLGETILVIALLLGSRLAEEVMS